MVIEFPELEETNSLSAETRVVRVTGHVIEDSEVVIVLEVIKQIPAYDKVFERRVGFGAIIEMDIPTAATKQENLMATTECIAQREHQLRKHGIRIVFERNTEFYRVMDKHEHTIICVGDMLEAVEIAEEYVEKHIEVKQVSIQYKDDDSDGKYKWKVYVNGKRYAAGATCGDAGAIVDEYLETTPNAVFVK